MPRRAPRDPLHAALRGPVPVPARRRAGVLRPGRHLPDRRGPRAHAGAVVRGRARAVRGDDPAAARLPRARALPLHDRARRAACCCCSRACPASASRSTAPTSASSSGRSRSSRRSSGRSRSSSSWPRTCATRGRCWSRARARFLGVTIPPLKHLGPLLVVWGAAMFMLVFIRDLGSSLMYFGGFLALLYVATNRLSFVTIGFGDVRARRVVLRLDGQPRAAARRHLAAPVQARTDRQAERLLPARAVRVRAGRRRAVRDRLRRLAAARAERGDADPGAAHRPHLLGDRQRGRPDGRLRAAARVPAAGRARLQGGADLRRLVLEAAGHRPHRGAGAAGVRDRRRRHARDPADRRHAAVRLLRRLLDRRQLRAGRAAAADLRPGAAARRAPRRAEGLR